MLRKLYLTLCLVSFGILAYAQTGALKGTVVDAKNNDPIPFANVVVLLNGSQQGAATTDFDGNFTIKPLNPGKYDVKVILLGFQSSMLTGILVNSDRISFVGNIKLSATAQELKETVVIAYHNPLIPKENVSGAIMDREQIAAAPTRDVNGIVSTSAGVTQADEGKEVNVRGGRNEATTYYVDGIKVIGNNPGVPTSGIEQIQVLTGGVPAQYGDATSGIISISTRGPSRTFNGGVEAVSSSLFDSYGYNLFNGSLTGPLYTKKGETNPLVGFFITGQYQSDKDSSPSAIGAYRVDDATLKNIQDNPLVSNGSFAAIQAAKFVEGNKIDHVNAHENLGDMSAAISGKIDIKPSANTTLNIGGTFYYNKRKQFSFSNQLFNAANNREIIDNDYRFFARFTQKFSDKTEKEKDKSSASIKNAYYTVQADFSRNNEIVQDPRFKDDFFKYGYIGQFKDYHAAPYTFKSTVDSAGGQSKLTHTIHQFATSDSAYIFNRDVINEDNRLLANYTKFVYDKFYGSGQIFPDFIVPLLGGLRNGDAPSNIYSLWRAPGTVINGYSKTDQTQFRLSANGSADIKDHNFVFGIEYEQRTIRGFALNPVGLWTTMRQVVNSHFTNNYDTTVNALNGDRSVHYHASLRDQSTFDLNLRNKLGLDPKGTDLINTDLYGPDQYSLSMFTAQDLMGSDGKGIIGAANSYYGYDYTGAVTTKKIAFEDYFTDSLNRPLDAWRPNYIAGYIQDKFTFRDLIVNIGLRVDRYDANQKVLKDKYILADYYTAGSDKFKNTFGEKPSNIGDDYAVYLDKLDYTQGTSNVVGYRSGDKFYDKNGIYVNDPTVFTRNTSNVFPMLVNSTNQNPRITPGLFTDYQAQINLMPRISFSFPISDDAQFFAHYDVLTKRPNADASRLSLPMYDYLASISTDFTVPNPDLKPEKTIDYELGFRQKLTPSSALTISAFYRELRDMVQLIYVKNGFPTDYRTYGNIDFGNVKGLSLSYDLRRTSNLRLTTSYTLQFAEATGSGTTSVAGLTKQDPAIRTPLPVDYDIRHNLVATVDYHFPRGEDYNGPMWFGKRFFEDAGVNFIFRYQTGAPFTRQESPTPEATAGLGNVRQSFVIGSINGSRMPSQFRVDAKVDKNFSLKWKTKSTETSHEASLNVYLQILNLLDAQNIIGVYRYSGSPQDDGWLSSSLGEVDVKTQASPQAYRDQYSIKVLNPFNYSLPRRVRLGVILNF